MTEWLIPLALVAFAIYKLGDLTELDLGRGWLRLTFAVPQAKESKTKNAKKEIGNGQKQI